ncbi:helix-turn-helix domain-containing protein [Aureimonas flava]|uniref:helix-turn-helix domain-containing protein n=1 Tax=Aureimonas flava TaxID=2320271 RepID=UPI001AED1221|nr:helix-turn-helix domain-containing protein [Aureimonas flava]
MTAERYRAPLRQGAPAAGHVHRNLDAGDGTDLFDLVPARNEVHPDFAARAAIWRDHGRGLISLAEAQRRSAAVGEKAFQSRTAISASRPRHARPAPNTSRQYAGEMATTAARDDRLTPNAKSLLTVLRARCGKGRRTEITKGTMGAVMSRSARTVRRYLVDLVRFGYIELEIRRTLRGLHTGLVVRLTEKALPFFEDSKGLAAWLAETPAAVAMPFTGRPLSGHQPIRDSERWGHSQSSLSGKPGVTLLSSKNQLRKSHLSEAMFSLLKGQGRRAKPPF